MASAAGNRLFEEILSADRRANDLITFWPGKNAIFTIRVVSHPYLNPAPPVVKPKATRKKAQTKPRGNF